MTKEKEQKFTKKDITDFVKRRNNTSTKILLAYIMNSIDYESHVFSAKTQSESLDDIYGDYGDHGSEENNKQLEDLTDNEIIDILYSVFK